MFLIKTTYGDIHICPACGHTATGKVLDRCPICGIRGDRFRKFKKY